MERPATSMHNLYKQLIAQLIVWKHTDLDIMLLGDFREEKI
jgi:hypothetical protein